MAATAVKALILLALSCSLAFGGVINVSSNSALNAANNDAGPGDTVKVATGTYTIQINPTNAGTSGSPIVYMPATAGSVCSLYVATPSINLTTDYVIVQGFRVKASNASNEMTVQSGDHTAIMDCYLYAFPSATASWDTWQITGDYCRFIGNVCNGLETSRDADGERHEGIVVGGLAKYFIVEGNTVSRITHYGITVQGGGSAPGPSWGVVRNNVAFDCHVNLGQNYYNKNNLYEGNRTYSGGQMLSYRPGISYEGSANQSIIRFNMFYNDSVDQNATGGHKGQMSEILTQSAGTIDYDNRLYGNAFVGLSRNDVMQTILLTQNDSEPNAMGKSVYVNNILAYANRTYGGYCYEYQDNSAGAEKDTFRTNLLWAQTPGDTVTKIDYTTRTLAETEADFPTLWSGNIETVPLWTDSLSLRGSRNFALSASSPCVDAGAALTTVASNVSSSTLVTVGDARYFHYDWGMSPYDRGDSVLIGTNRCELDSVDYTNRRLILKSAITVTAGAGVHVLATYRTATASYTTRLSGSAPDIGPYERASTGGGGVTLPGSTTQVAPDSNSSQMQPVTFRWRAVTGATKYWFSLSGDNWGSLLVNNAALTDTFITVSGITPGTWCVWNVATGNSAGWNTDAWATWWTVEIGDNAPTADTLTVDWNKTITQSDITASTAIEFANLQRRDMLLVLRNASGNTVEWPVSVKWIGMDAAPQPAIGDTTVYWFVRDGTVVYGFDLSAQAAGSGVTASWVVSQLGSYGRKASGMLFVSPAYSGLSSPYYSDVATAVAAASSGDVIYISPGTYTGGFTVGVDNLTILGETPAEFQSSDSTFAAGVLINGTCSAGGKKNFTMQNVTIAKRDTDGDVFSCGTTGSAKVNHTYINCRFVGTSWGNGSHAFLAQAGSHITLRDCKVYRSSHGFALRASYISASGLYAEDCGSESGIIIKAATGSGSAEYVNVTDFTITATVAGRARGVVILCSNTGVRTSQVNLTNGVIYGTAGAGVYVLEDAGSVSDVTVSSVNVRKAGGPGFWIGSGSRINFINCLSDSAGSYGFLNTSGSNVSVAGARVNASSTYSGSFTTEIAGAVQVYGAATLGSAGVTGDLSASGVVTLDSILYMKRHIYFLDKAGTNWHAFAVRNATGSQAVYDLSNVGTLSAFGLGTFGDLSTTDELSVGGNANFDAPLYMKSGQSILNKAANNWLAFATRNTSASEAVYDLDYVGNIVTRNATANLFNTNATTVNFAGAADRITIGKTGDSVHVLGNLWSGGYDPVYGKYPLGVNGTSFLFGTVYIKDDTWLGTYNGSGAGVKFTQTTGTVTFRGTRFALSSLQTAPSSATDTGTTGEFRITATGIYICTATNTWVRCLASSW